MSNLGWVKCLNFYAKWKHLANLMNKRKHNSDKIVCDALFFYF